MLQLIRCYRRYARPIPPDFLTILLPMLAVSILLFGSPQAKNRTVVSGTVYDADTRSPIPFATVQVVGFDRATPANAEGRYRIVLDSAIGSLRFSHIAYYSETVDLSLFDEYLNLDIFLRPHLVDIGTITTYSRRLDPGQRIIAEAIKRKEDILAKINDYRYDAYTKLVVTD